MISGEYREGTSWASNYSVFKTPLYPEFEKTTIRGLLLLAAVESGHDKWLDKTKHALKLLTSMLAQSKRNAG